MAGLVALLGTVQLAAAQEPSVAGLWQKIDEQTGKPVIWFLFVGHRGFLGRYELNSAEEHDQPGDDQPCQLPCQGPLLR